MKFRWAQPRFEALVPAKKFGQFLTSLPDQNPATIVEAASDRKSPAHKLFQWDDSVAAREHRLTQARLLLGSFVIETEIASSKGTPKVIDVPFVSRAAPGSYEITTRALKVTAKRDFMLREALQEANRWRRRYANLNELAIVFSAMDEVQGRVQRRNG